MRRQLATQQARANLPIATIENLTGDERVASFLIELPLRLGNSSPEGLSFRGPFCHIVIADYLALNADTLSRIMSRLKVRDIVMQKAREHTLASDEKVLCDLSPITNAMVALHSPALS